MAPVQIYIYMYFKIFWFCDFQEYIYISFKACIIPKYSLITASHRLMCISCVIDNLCTSSSSQRWEYLSVPRMAGVTFFFCKFLKLYRVSEKWPCNQFQYLTFSQVDVFYRYSFCSPLTFEVFKPCHFHLSCFLYH